MTFNEFAEFRGTGDRSNWDILTAGINLFIIEQLKPMVLNDSNGQLETDPILNGIFIMDFISTHFYWQYADFDILYDNISNGFHLTMVYLLQQTIIKHLPNIVFTLRQQRLASSTWWQQIENYGYFNSGNNANENSYNGYDADGVFSRSKNTMSSKNGDVLGYLLKMNKPINNVLNILCSDIEMLLKTIY